MCNGTWQQLDLAESSAMGPGRGRMSSSRYILKFSLTLVLFFKMRRPRAQVLVYVQDFLLGLIEIGEGHGSLEGHLGK
jgi:hypothetical protein